MSDKTIRVALLAILTATCALSRGQTALSKFERIFAWGMPRDEDTARAYSEIGVTDIRVADAQQLELALRFGMIPYCGTFSPRGRHRQVMSPGEEEHFAYINGHDLKHLGPEERKNLVNRRRIEMNHRYGGEPIAGLDNLNSARIACFNSDADHEISKKALDAICARVPGVKGIYFDYIGYSNFKGCYCDVCLSDCKAYLSGKSLPDNRQNRDLFYRELLVDYFNAMVDYVHQQYPDFKVVAHIYPVFLPDPLYGNRTKADFCGQTVAWYFPWDEVKIADYTRITVEQANRYFKAVRGVPFVGLNRRPGSLWSKTPATLERELRTILQAGGRTLMVCNGSDMLEPGIREVFRSFAAGQGVGFVPGR